MKKNNALPCSNSGAVDRHNICFVAGRSGGHIIPALTLAQHHQDSHPESTVIFISTNTPLDLQLIQAHPAIDHHIPLALGNVPYKKVHHYPRFMLHVLRSFWQSLRALRRHKITKVISMGGYISVPVCLAAKILRIPIELHELNAIPGKAAKVLASIVQKIVVCFNKAARSFPHDKCHIQPYPVRFTQQDKQVTLEPLQAALGFSATKKTLLIVGGSQGSLFINNLVKEWIEQTPSMHAKIQIIHQTGAQDSTDWTSWYAQHQIPAQVFSYHHAIQDYYVMADLIICRSGAGTLWEGIFFEKRMITIPLETENTDHQVDNAYAIATQYPLLCTVVTQKKIAQNKAPLFDLITNMLLAEQLYEQHLLLKQMYQKW